MPRTPLFRPTAFFEERPNLGLVEPALIAWSAGVLLLGSVVLSVDLGVDAGIAQLLVAAAIGGAVGGIVAWVVVSAVIYGVSALLGGEGGGILDTAAAVGWGYAPMVVGGFVDVVAALLLSETTNTVADPFASPLSFVLAALGVGFILWQGYVWYAAARHVRNLTRLQAVLAVTIPVGLPLVIWMG